MLATPVFAAARRVIFVEAGHQGGTGTSGNPVGSISEAEQISRTDDVIFVAEATTPYEESVALKHGQMLIGSAFGLDAVRAELHVELDAPAVAAAAGAGPVIHGTISLSGNNVVAGCTLIADASSATAVSAQSPDGPITLRSIFVRTSNGASGLYVGNASAEVRWIGGRLDAAQRGAGIFITGGGADITVTHVPIEGDFVNVIAVRGRTGGSVAFRDGSTIKVRNASGDAVTLIDSRGTVAFESPLQIDASDGRGLVANRVQKLVINGGSSWIDAMNATALDIRDSQLDVELQHISAERDAGTRMSDGMLLDKVSGRFDITGDGSTAGSGGTIRNALAYGVRITQSSSVHLRNMAIVGGGSGDSPEECPRDIPKQTNLRCRAGLYLRHVENARFENITIEDNGGVGLNANNLVDSTFEQIRVTRTGTQLAEPALLIDEARGKIIFTLCSFIDGTGGAAVIEQRFNSARLTFDRCDFSAPGRPQSAPSLLRARVAGFGRLRLDLLDARVHDNAGSGVDVAASDASTLAFRVTSSYMQQLGSPAVKIAGSDSSIVCAALSGNVIIGGANPAVQFVGTAAAASQCP